jgi:hypothetical protein
VSAAGLYPKGNRICVVTRALPRERRLQLNEVPVKTCPAVPARAERGGRRQLLQLVVVVVEWQLLQLVVVVVEWQLLQLVVVVVEWQLLQPHLTANPALCSASSTISAKISASVTYL